MANWASKQNLGDPLSRGWQEKNLKWIEPVKGQRWQVYGPAAPAFEGLLNDLLKLGYHPLSSGGFNYRNIRGSDKLSQHAFGTAIDLNSMTNAMGQSASDIPHAADLAKKWGLEWGGNWQGRPDPMHFEFTGTGTPDAPFDQNAVAQMQQAGYTPEQIKAAFLSTIASGESPGYDVMYGGQKFTDYSKHPHQMQPIFDPSHPGQVVGHADVAGRYQFKGSTWDELAKKYGYKDFTPATQDAAAWQYAGDVFKQKTGGDLQAALQSGDPGQINAAAQVLNQTWSSLPGGKEQSKGYGGKTFYDIYNKALGPKPSGYPDEGASHFGGTGLGQPAATSTAPATAGAATKDSLDKYTQAATDAIGGFADMKAPVMGAGGRAPQLPTMAPTALDPVPITAPGVDDARRNQLAMLMQRLNTKTLWG